MDLTALPLRAAAARPHVLVVPPVGQTGVRLAVEAELARRAWPSATSPADTDLLIVAGTTGPALDPVVDALWQQVPPPRALVRIIDAEDVAAALDAARPRLLDVTQQRVTASAAAPTIAPNPDDRANYTEHTEHTEHEHREHEHPGHEHPGHEHPGHEHPGHESHDGREGGENDGEYGGADGTHNDGEHDGHHGHHGGGMALLGGLAMADLGEDRDGLTLDRLHVALGPVLPDWPAGLVLRVTLQGDVIQEATAEILDAGHGAAFWSGRRPATRELDGLGRFLGVAGWASAADRSRHLRDELLAGTPDDRLAARVQRLVARVRRSRTLRWSLRGLPAGPQDLDCLLESRLEAVLTALADPAAIPAPRPTPAELPELLVGAELAAARLIVAALDPDTEPGTRPDAESAAVRAEVRHG